MVTLRRIFVRATLIAAAAALLGPPMLIILYRFVPPPITSLMIVRRAQGYPINKEWKTLDEVGPALREAAVASEDQAFCNEQWGFDMRAVRTNVKTWERGARRPKGASTIAMQTARNLFLWPQRGVVRKVLEAWLTPQIALLWPKRRLLEVYLNVVELGPGIYGVEAASQYYYHKPAAALSLEESGRIVAIMPNPLRWHAQPPSAYVRRRADDIASMVTAGEADLRCIRRQ